MHPRHSAVLSAVALLVLLLSAPAPSDAVAQLRGAATAPDPLGPVVAAVALGAWVLVGWLLLTAGLLLAARTPGTAGRLATLLVRRVAPCAVRRALELALGVAVTVGTAAGPAAALADAAPASTGSDGGVAVVDLDWPATGADRAVAPAPVPVPERAPAAPAARPAPPVAPPAAPPAASAVAPPVAPPAAAPAQPAPAAASPARHAPAPAALPITEPVVVVPGDTLWQLAETHLERSGTEAPTDRQIAEAWPTWWSANREAVGDDPDLILPGTVLRPPPASPGA